MEESKKSQTVVLQYGWLVGWSLTSLSSTNSSPLEQVLEGSTWKKCQLECGPMPNVMVALPNTGGALCSMPQSLADAHYQMPCSNDAKRRKPLKFSRVPQTTGWISAVSRPKFTILRGYVEDISLLNKFFPIVDTCLSCKDIAR